MGERTLHAGLCLPSKNIGQPDEAFHRNFLRPRGRLDSGRSEQRARVHTQRLKALAQHLAALPEGRFGQALQRRASQASGWARGTSRTTDDVTLGGGTKAVGATSNMIFVSQRQFASTDSRP